MQSLIAPELTPTHARSVALVERLFACFIGTRIPQIFPAGQSALLRDTSYYTLNEFTKHNDARKIFHWKIHHIRTYILKNYKKKSDIHIISIII